MLYVVIIIIQSMNDTSCASFGFYLQSTSYRVTQMNAGNEYVFRVKAINAVGEGPPGELSDPVLATDRRESIKSISTLADSESVDYSEYSDYPESEYDPDLDGE